jgi:hypothetical protein
VPVEDETGV